MPIKGLTDSVIPQFPCIGKLRKGDEKIGNKPGEELPYWRFTSSRPEVVKAFYEFYPQEPATVQIYIPYATPDEAFPNWCEVWTASGLDHRCDGENMTVWLEGDKYARGTKPCRGGHKDNDPLKDSVGRLSVIIPTLWEAGYVGYVTMETHGKNDILSISRALAATYEARQNNALGLRGILFNLRRVPEKISYGTKEGKRSLTNKYMVKIEPAADWVMMQLEAAHNIQMLSSGEVVDAESNQVLQLPEPQPEPKQEERKSDLDLIGSALWIERWPDMKSAVLKQTKGDEKSAFEIVKKRILDVHDIDMMKKHVKKAWPGFEAYIDEVVKLSGKFYEPLKLIQGISAVAQFDEEHLKGLDDEARISAILANSDMVAD